MRASTTYESTRKGEEMIYLLANGCQSTNTNGPKSRSDFIFKLFYFFDDIFEKINHKQICYVNFLTSSYIVDKFMGKNASLKFLDAIIEAVNSCVKVLTLKSFEIDDIFFINLIPKDKDSKDLIKKGLFQKKDDYNETMELCKKYYCSLEFD